MSIARPLAAAVRPVKDLLPGDEPGHKDPSQVFEDLNAPNELPQGALMLLAQLQPLRELPLKLSLAPLRSGTEPGLAKVSVDRTMYLPMKQSSVPSSPVLVNARPALADRLPNVVQVPDRTAVANALAAPDQAAVDASARQKAPLSSTGVPVALQTQETERTADADRLVKQVAPQALPTQPPPLLEKSLHLHHATHLAVAAKPASEPKSAPEASITREGRSYLQVPFSKGNAVGLITVSKAGGEYPEQLLLKPDSTSVSSYLSDDLAQVQDARWRLADQQAHEDPHERERPDENVEEQSRQTLRDRIERGGQQA